MQRFAGRVQRGACGRAVGGAGTLRAREQRDVVAAAVTSRCERLRRCQAARWREREETSLRLETYGDGDGDVKCAGLGAAEGNDRSSGWWALGMLDRHLARAPLMWLIDSDPRKTAPTVV